MLGHAFVKNILLGTIIALACSCNNEAGKIDKTSTGAALGAIAGGLLGSTIGKGSGRTAAAVVGATLGGLAGGSIGKQMDKADVEAMKNAQGQAFEYGKTGHAVEWHNPDSGISGYITPNHTYIDQRGQNCREYTQVIKVGGQVQQAFGRACRRYDGSWEIIN